MKIALGIEYNGYSYHGWQAQKNLITIQGCLEDALSKIADERITTHCAGRTDAGVHAIGQVIHFQTNAIRNMRAWLLGTNAYLPSTIAVRWAQVVDDSFHARHSALSRSYRYIIYNHTSRPALLTSRVTWNYDILNIATMQAASQYLIGELDFTSFRSSECESTSPMRNLNRLIVQRIDDYIVIDVQANAFLHHMVRNIVGALMHVGAGFKEPEWIQEVLLAKDRRKAAETASAHGLYLIKVTYPEIYKIPIKNNGLLLV
jgi:tRNA pseudouridine38-40 synthase